MSKYTWLQENNKKNKEWTEEQNRRTDDWFSPMELADRIHFLKSKEKRPLYREIIECDNLIYACKQTPDGSLSIVKMDSKFHELKTIISSDTDAYGFVPLTVIPNPLHTHIVAMQVFRIGYTDPSLVVWDEQENTSIIMIDDVFYFDWSLDGERLYYSDAKTDVENGRKTNYLRVLCLRELKIRDLYEDTHNAIWIQPLVSKAGTVLIHIFLDYRSVILKLFDPMTETIHTVCENSSNCMYLGIINEIYYMYSNHRKENGEIFTFTYANEPIKLTCIYSSNTLLTGAALIKETLYLISIVEGANILERIDKEGNNQKRIQLPDTYGAIDTLSGVKRDNGLYSNYFYMNYQSFLYPQSVFRIDPYNDEIIVMASATEISKTKAIVEKCRIDTRDGKQTIAYLVYEPEKTKLRATPTLMYGYGGYGDSTVPWYNDQFLDLDIIDWIERGGLYVHCILRGGGEFGEAWHRDGMLDRKKNTFYDFIDIAEWLIRQNYTCSDYLAINGGSNGGLLTAAVVVLRPELFKAAVINLPLTDMINYCNDERGPMYITEFGDPRGELKEYIRSYSPFHNLQRGVGYPAVFIQSGELDRNVPCYHSKKFYERIRECSISREPCLLKILEKGAHDLGTGEEHYRLCAQEQLFLEHMLKIK